MKKLIILVFCIFFSSTIYAEGFNGIFGIEFGKEQESVKKSMKEKGWNLSETDGTSLIYKKNKGTYANLPVEKIKFYFFEDKLYEIDVHFPINTKSDDVIDAVKAIQETYSLTYVNDDKANYDGSTILMYTYTDPKLNIFNLNVLAYKSLTSTWFELKDFTISNEKKAADEKKKQEETAKKNKSISSDL